MELKLRLFILLLITNLTVFSQDSLTVAQDSLKPPKVVSAWTFKNKGNLDFNEIAFVNWNAGGTSSISALAGLESALNYKKGLLTWKTKGVLRYGVNKQQNVEELRKTEDLIELNSALGYRTDTITNWFYSARVNFKTQFSNGYKYPDVSTPISRFMAPGYLFVGGGVEYGKNIDTFSLYMSPLTVKATFVLDEELSREGAFGVEPAIILPNGTVIREGERVREEVGILIQSNHEATIWDNISIKNAISLYSDYLNDFGNIDVDWEAVFNFKVNHFVKANLGSHLRYDNDIKITEVPEIEAERETIRGAKVQWKQLLGIGVEVVF